MTRLEYRALLGTLPVSNPTPDQMAALCPHLNREQAVQAFTTGDGYVACPAVKVQDTYHVLHYSPEYVERRMKKDGGEVRINRPAQITHAYVGRALENKSDEPHWKSAVLYAGVMWGGELVRNDWADVVRFTIQNPTQLVRVGTVTDQPRTTAVVWATLSCELNGRPKATAPESVELNAIITHTTLNRIEGEEMAAGRATFNFHNCGNCGAGLNLTCCNGCRQVFHDNGVRSGWDTPLPWKVFQCLRAHGITFRISPGQAWDRELDQFMVRRREQLFAELRSRQTL